jgi:recombinational DNA repair ATPase RecF
VIQLERIEITEFRGIRHLALDLSSKSFVIWGPNGSGKSGVVDAIEFALTGNISRLSGEGSAGVTVTRHGPHVHRRNEPDGSEVSLTVRDSQTGAVAVLTRNVKTYKSYTLTPDTSGVRVAIERAAAHPELSLSRREIIKYVTAESGKRSREVQALLKLDRIGDTRSVLRTTRTKLSAGRKLAANQLDEAREFLIRHFNVPDLVLPEILQIINRRRQLLGLPDIQSLSNVVRVDDGLQQTEPHAFNRSSAIRDTEALSSELLAMSNAELTEFARIRSILGELVADPQLLQEVSKKDFFSKGLSYVGDCECPLCGHAWDSSAELRHRIEARVDSSQRAIRLKDAVEASALELRQHLIRLLSLLAGVQPLAEAYEFSHLSHAISAWSNDLKSLVSSLSSMDGIIDVQDRLLDQPTIVPDSMLGDVDALAHRFRSMPDQSESVSAQSFLAVAQERLSVFWRRRREFEAARSADIVAQAAYRSYCDATEAALSELYSNVEQQFESYYRFINAEDEANFTAKLGPSEGKLDLHVDFYGIGMFPPLAYHSEGHQDGMGVCLYLALVKQLLGAEFRFAVLDDVVMSVDSSHRRKFCTLLMSIFPETQFIITTHDQVWARQMQSAGLVGRKSLARFDGWTVNDGPHVAESGDLWGDIDVNLRRAMCPRPLNAFEEGWRASHQI